MVDTMNNGPTLTPSEAPDDAQPAGPIPALTIVSHHNPERVGGVLLLKKLAEGQKVEVSRLSPEFVAPGSALGASLADPFLSRSPLVFSPGPEGRVRLDPGEGRQVSIADEPLRGAREFSLEEMTDGVPLELAGRMLLLLHLADPREESAGNGLGMVGTSRGLQGVRRRIEAVADLDLSVLLRGETGVGKELVAQAIHRSSLRRNKPLVSVNMATLSKDLAASELFGVVKGAFTGAVKDREGFFHAADGGTLFLDEVGETPPEVQAMLLRVLEYRELFRVGSRVPEKVNVRLMTATDAYLEQRVQEGSFNEPLMFRLKEYEIRIPPLRQRREDIGLLFHAFARKQLELLGEANVLEPRDVKEAPWLPASLASLLVRCEWPGNIRQLYNLTRQLVIDSRGQRSLKLDPALKQELAAPGGSAAPLEPPKEQSRHKISQYTEQEVVAALKTNDWKIQPTARQLGIARTTLHDWLDRNPHVRVGTA